MMSNSDFDKKFELLKMARDLLNDEYLNLRAEQHNKWLVIDNKMKKTHGLNVPYPAFVPFPTEQAILKKARALYAFIDEERTFDNNSPVDILVDNAVTNVVAHVEEIIEESPSPILVEESPPLVVEQEIVPIVEPTPVEPEIVPIVEPTPVEPPIPIIVAEPITVTFPAAVASLPSHRVGSMIDNTEELPPADTDTDTHKSLLPGWVRRKL